MPTEVKAQNTTTLASVKAIYDAADQANTLLDGMQTAATAAGTTLDGIYQDAADAATAADNAQQAADTALVNLATTENVVGVLNWITAHGTMTLTSDVTVNPAHVYFVVDPAGDYVVGGTHYSVVAEPTDDDIATYYELSVDESVQNYVATHIVVDSEGLWIIPDAGGNKVLIATGSGSTYTTAGTYIVGKVGGVDTVLAEFTASGAQIGRNDGGNVSIDNNSVDINDGVSQLATFGADGAQIGKDDENRLIITPIELLQKNADGAVFFNVNTDNGVKTISVTLSGASGSKKQAISASGSTTATSEIAIPSDLEPGTTVELSSMTGKIKPQYKSSMFGFSITFSNNTFDSAYKDKTIVDENTNACFDTPSISITTGTNSSNTYSCDVTIKESSTTIETYTMTCDVAYSSSTNKCTATWTVQNTFSASKTVTITWSGLQGVFSYSTTVPYYVLGTSADASVGAFSIVGGQSVYATSDNQASFGKFNVQDINNDYAFIVGNGSDSANRSNALTVDWSGNVEAAGDVTDGASNTLSSVASALATVQEVQSTYGVLTDLTGNTSLTTSAKKLPLKTFSGNGCSLSSNGIKVTKAGTYLVSGTAYFHSNFTANDIVHLQLYRNSTLLEDFGVRMALAAPYENVTLSPYIVTLSANDVMYLYAYNQTAARGQINTGSTRNFLMLNRIA